MSDLVREIADVIKARRLTSLRTGTIAADGATVTQSGGTVPVSGWLHGVRTTPGQPVLLAMVEGPDAQAAAVVLGVLSSARDTRAWSGTVTAVDTGTYTCTVTIGGVSTPGVLYLYPSSPPSIGQVVALDYRDHVILALGPLTPPPAAPPPPRVEPSPDAAPSNVTPTGTTRLAAVASGSFDLSRGLWNSYYGTGVYQGSGYGNVLAGAWFHGTAPAQLAGKTLTRATLNLGGLQRAGSYNTSRTVNLYRTTATSKSGEPPRSEGPISVTVPAITDGWWSNPVITSAAYPGLLTMAANMVTAGGGGLVITGNPYLGLTGVSSPASGLLTLEWKA